MSHDNGKSKILRNLIQTGRGGATQEKYGAKWVHRDRLKDIVPAPGSSNKRSKPTRNQSWTMVLQHGTARTNVQSRFRMIVVFAYGLL